MSDVLSAEDHIFEKASDKTEYDDVVNIADVRTDIKIGGTTEKFVPNINMKKWDDEAWLNINHPDVVGTEKEVEKDGIISLEIGNNTHKYYVDENGHLEYEIILKTKPVSNKIELNLNSSAGLQFWFQPPLTQKEIDAGFKRPENVIDSYAVYWKKKNNQYKTGKFCHIYRIKAIDKNGKWSWCKQRINGKMWAITISQDFLDNAVYPIIIDPILGYNTAGASTAHAQTTLRGSISQTGANGGNITKFHIAIAAVDATDKRHLMSVCDASQVENYDPSDQSVIEQVEIDPVVISDDNWVDAPVGNNISGNTWFFLVIKSPSTNTEHKFDSGTLHYWQFSTITYEIPDPLMSSFAYGGLYAISTWVDYEQSQYTEDLLIISETVRDLLAISESSRDITIISEVES